ncbi:hypothetical protein PIIN_06861 [Serendipita indica DSM 11827]|uniref:Uncharacterized protein n=1 Tax=Serendipita indica (strain DSM 11827) TaxID=1109443 RepID=G4TNN2_SERID|nr:hypothetical protein PIIN_06861 [Serendipita indica DSM 11827]
MNTPLESQTTKISLINAFFLIGLVLDIMAACLSFLTSRWLGRLTVGEKEFLNKWFDERDKRAANKAKADPPGDTQPAAENDTEAYSPGPVGVVEKFIVWWTSLSLFIPLPLIVFGVGFMAVGIQIYIWTLQKRLVAIMVTIAYAGVTPFLIGVFVIGREPDRRERIMYKLAMRRGDW